jgi:PPOX class probable F420-dependent enzyme
MQVGINYLLTRQRMWKTIMNLQEAAYISFATFRKSGKAVETPVWFAGDTEDIDQQGRQCYYIFSAGEAGKVKRLRNSARSRIAPCTVTGKVLGDWHNSASTILHTSEEIALAQAALVKKYGWQMRMIDLSSKLAGKYNKRAYIRVCLTENSE